MNFLDTIAARRDGGSNTKDQLEALAKGAADGSIPDYQLSAWLMAAYLNPLSPQETADLTLAMAHSGERLDLSGIPGPHLDKHSTGGVGDKTTLVVLPILAACGVTVVKMSGRGLGITGGTIDKLESIPGFRTDLTPEEMVAQAKKIGIALSGQTPRLAPADRALYSLRDVTGTVSSIPLITASILSKKIAGGADTVVLDVKCGSGAFMKTLPEAEALAHALVDTGKLCGLKISAVITDMDQPLGTMVGNANEVAEALWILSGRYAGGKLDLRPPPGIVRFRDLCVDLAGHALEVVGKGNRETALEALASGRAHEKAMQWFEAQGANPRRLLGSLKSQTPGALKIIGYNGKSGYVRRIDAEAVGEAVLNLGGGRREKADQIDHVVGVTLHVSIGARIDNRSRPFTVFAKSVADAKAIRPVLLTAIEVSSDPVTPSPAILKTVT